MYRISGRLMPQALSPAQLISIRKSLGYSVSDFAKLLDVSVETMRSWESGRRGCNGPAATLIQLVERNDYAHEYCRLLAEMETKK